MNKKNVYILIFAIIFFIGALAFLLSTFSDNNTNQNNANYSSSETTKETSDTTNVENTSNISNNSDSTSENLPDIEFASLIDFTFYNADNNEFKISRYKDKPIAIMFSNFSENYDVCVEYLSFLNSYHEKYKSNVQFLCIDKSNFIETDSNIEVYKDKDGIEKYSISELPTLVFINREGEIMNQVTSITLDSLEANLDLITGNF